MKIIIIVFVVIIILLTIRPIESFKESIDIAPADKNPMGKYIPNSKNGELLQFMIEGPKYNTDYYLQNLSDIKPVLGSCGDSTLCKSTYAVSTYKPYQSYVINNEGNGKWIFKRVMSPTCLCRSNENIYFNDIVTIHLKKDEMNLISCNNNKTSTSLVKSCRNTISDEDLKCVDLKNWYNNSTGLISKTTTQNSLNNCNNWTGEGGKWEKNYSNTCLSYGCDSDIYSSVSVSNDTSYFLNDAEKWKIISPEGKTGPIKYNDKIKLLNQWGDKSYLNVCGLSNKCGEGIWKDVSTTKNINSNIEDNTNWMLVVKLPLPIGCKLTIPNGFTTKCKTNSKGMIESGETCSFTKTGYVCESQKCENGKLIPNVINCKELGCKITIPNDLKTNCDKYLNSSVPSGISCTYTKPGYLCNSQECYMGKLSPNKVSCKSVDGPLFNIPYYLENLQGIKSILASCGYAKSQKWKKACTSQLAISTYKQDNSYITKSPNWSQWILTNINNSNDNGNISFNDIVTIRLKANKWYLVTCETDQCNGSSLYAVSGKSTINKSNNEGYWQVISPQGKIGTVQFNDEIKLLNLVGSKSYLNTCWWSQDCGSGKYYAVNTAKQNSSDSKSATTNWKFLTAVNCPQVKSYVPTNEYGICSKSNPCSPDPNIKIRFNGKGSKCLGIDQSPGDGGCNNYCSVSKKGSYYRSDLGGCISNYCACPTKESLNDSWFKKVCVKKSNFLMADDGSDNTSYFWTLSSNKNMAVTYPGGFKNADINNIQQKFRIKRCKPGFNPLGGVNSWFPTNASKQDRIIRSGDIIAIYSPQNNKVYDCAWGPGQPCSHQPFPPPGGNWGTPMKIHVQSGSNGDKVDLSFVVYFTRMWYARWNTQKSLNCNNTNCKGIDISQKTTFKFRPIV